MLQIFQCFSSDIIKTSMSLKIIPRKHSAILNAIKWHWINVTSQKSFSELKNLDLFNCEVTTLENYRDKVFEYLEGLQYLDGYDRNNEEAEEDEDEEVDGEDGRDDEEEDEEDGEVEADSDDDGELCKT